VRKGICIFCQKQAKLTPEHIWPRWTTKLFPNQKFTIQRVDGRDGSVLQEWRDSGISVSPKLVCKECNEGWMSDIETKASTVIKKMVNTQGRIQLSFSEVTSLAEFTFKTSVLADHLSSGRKPFFTPSTRNHFAQSRAIPDGVQMWFSSVQGPHQYGLYLPLWYERPHGAQSGVNFYVFNFVVGRLLLQSVAKRWAKKSHQYLGFPFFEQNLRASFFANHFWPPGRPSAVTDWPPDQPLTEQLINEFFTRWGAWEIN
jgi:hypothetical protein